MMCHSGKGVTGVGCICIRSGINTVGYWEGISMSLFVVGRSVQLF